MGMPGDDDVVQIQKGNNPSDPCIITVNCPDKAGLACDISRIILDFGLYISKGGIKPLFVTQLLSFTFSDSSFSSLPLGVGLPLRVRIEF